MNQPLRALVVLPSYNERENIVRLVQTILGLYPTACVCVVDDMSPDGTRHVLGDAIRERAGWNERVHLVVRAKKDGRGGAVRAGFAWGRASDRGFEAFVEMDCDFSHEPQAIAEGLHLLAAGNDVVIGARYPDGVIVGWPLRRRIFSACANMLAGALIEGSIADYTNGFRFYAPRAVDVLLAHEQKHRGYIYLSESLSYLIRARMTVTSFPIRFVNRERGVSNTSLREISEAFLAIFKIALSSRFSGS